MNLTPEMIRLCARVQSGPTGAGHRHESRQSVRETERMWTEQAREDEPFKAEADIDGFRLWANYFGDWHIFGRLDGFDCLVTGGSHGGHGLRGKKDAAKEAALTALERLKIAGLTPRA